MYRLVNQALNHQSNPQLNQLHNQPFSQQQRRRPNQAINLLVNQRQCRQLNRLHNLVLLQVRNQVQSRVSDQAVSLHQYLLGSLLLSQP